MSGNLLGGYSHNPSDDHVIFFLFVAIIIIMLAAMGLISFCIRRCRESPKGIKKRALELIPIVSFSPELNMIGSECLICLGEFVEGETVRVLPNCNHGFHVKCIDTWLLLNASCSNGKQSLRQHQTPVTAQV